MNSLIFSFSTIFPLFMMLSIGYGVKSLKWISEKAIKEMNQVCFKVFLPMSLFINVYHSKFSTEEIPLILFAVGAVVLSFILILGFVNYSKQTRNRKGVLVQGMFRSNYILFGLPLAISFFGENNTGATAMLIAIIVPLYNMLSILVLQIYQEKAVDLKSVIIGSLKNPLILGSLAAFSCILLSIQIPKFLLSGLNDIGRAATPLALMLLGASFEFKKVAHNIKELLLVVLVKLVVLPSIVVACAIALGFTNEALVALLAMSASPTAVSSYTMAQSMGMDDELAGQIVVTTTILCIITLFLWITLLKQGQIV